MSKHSQRPSAYTLVRTYLPVFSLLLGVVVVAVLIEAWRIHDRDIERYKGARADKGSSSLTDISIDRTFSLTPFDADLKDAQVVFLSGKDGEVRISFFLVEKFDHSLVCGDRLGPMTADHVLSGALRFKGKVLLLGQVIPRVGADPIFVEIGASSAKSGNSVSGSQLYSVYGQEFVSEGLFPDGSSDQVVTKLCVMYQSKGFDAVGYSDTDCDKTTVVQVPIDVQKLAVDIH